MKKEEWIDDILNSGKQLQPVGSNPLMAGRIEMKLQQNNSARLIPLRWIYACAACILVLIAFNVFVLISTSIARHDSNGVQQLIQEYGWSNDNIFSFTTAKRPA